MVLLGAAEDLTAGAGAASGAGAGAGAGVGSGATSCGVGVRAATGCGTGVGMTAGKGKVPLLSSNFGKLPVRYIAYPASPINPRPNAVHSNLLLIVPDPFSAPGLTGGMYVGVSG